VPFDVWPRGLSEAIAREPIPLKTQIFHSQSLHIFVQSRQKFFNFGIPQQKKKIEKKTNNDDNPGYVRSSAHFAEKTRGG
jgi:hypothetical protein